MVRLIQLAQMKPLAADVNDARNALIKEQKNKQKPLSKPKKKA